MRGNEKTSCILMSAIFFILLIVILSAGCIISDTESDVAKMGEQSWSSLSDPYVVLDCDPGCDDAYGIFLPAVILRDSDLPDLYVATAGNAPRSTAARNLALLHTYLQLKGKTALGAEVRIDGTLGAFSTFHGVDGLGGTAASLAKKIGFTEDEFKFDFQTTEEIAEELLKQNNITYIATGPLSTLASLLITKPDLKNHIKSVYIMGGGINIFDTKNEGEYNFMIDPDAANVVLSSGLDITLFPLDITLPYASLSSFDITMIKKRGGFPEMQALLEHLSEVNQGVGYYANLKHYQSLGDVKPVYLEKGYAILHDILPVLYSYKPNLFVIKDRSIYVDEYGHSIEGDEGFRVHVAEELKVPDYLLKLLLEVHSKQ